MNCAWIEEYLLSKKGVKKDLQVEWNWIRYRIKDKMFAAICLDKTNQPYYITIKLEPMEGMWLRERYKDIIPGYYMNKLHWNSINVNGEITEELLKELLDKSYWIVFKGFSKKKQKEILGNEVNESNFV